MVLIRKNKCLLFSNKKEFNFAKKLSMGTVEYSKELKRKGFKICFKNLSDAIHVESGLIKAEQKRIACENAGLTL